MNYKNNALAFFVIIFFGTSLCQAVISREVWDRLDRSPEDAVLADKQQLQAAAKYLAERERRGGYQIEFDRIINLYASHPSLYAGFVLDPIVVAAIAARRSAASVPLPAPQGASPDQQRKIDLFSRANQLASYQGNLGDEEQRKFDEIIDRYALDPSLYQGFALSTFLSQEIADRTQALRADGRLPQASDQRVDVPAAPADQRRGMFGTAYAPQAPFGRVRPELSLDHEVSNLAQSCPSGAHPAHPTARGLSGAAQASPVFPTFGGAGGSPHRGGSSPELGAGAPSRGSSASPLSQDVPVTPSGGQGAGAPRPRQTLAEAIENYRKGFVQEVEYGGRVATSQDWLNFANEDFKAAQALCAAAGDPVRDHQLLVRALYFVCMAVEKYVKALLIIFGIRTSRSHNLATIFDVFKAYYNTTQGSHSKTFQLFQCLKREYAQAKFISDSLRYPTGALIGNQDIEKYFASQSAYCADLRALVGHNMGQLPRPLVPDFYELSTAYIPLAAVASDPSGSSGPVGASPSAGAAAFAASASFPRPQDSRVDAMPVPRGAGSAGPGRFYPSAVLGSVSSPLPSDAFVLGGRAASTGSGASPIPLGIGALSSGGRGSPTPGRTSGGRGAQGAPPQSPAARPGMPGVFYIPPSSAPFPYLQIRPPNQPFGPS